MKMNRMRSEERGARGEVAGRESTTRCGLTLIELLVVIVILTTLVGGVIPVLSPNNDTRKIRAAARGLQTYINVVQAKAARTGRPHGIAFRESSPGSGVALEVFGLEVPPSFAGFSTESRSLTVKAEQFNVNDGRDMGTAPTTYGPRDSFNPRGNNGKEYSPQYDGRDLYVLHFRFGTSPGLDLKSEDDIPSDILPPKTFQVGDVIDVEGNRFLVVDDDDYYYGPQSEDYPFIDVSNNRGWYKNRLICIWLNETGQVAPHGNKPYQILRQPKNSSEAPFQLPAGIVIDMQASVGEGSVSAPITGRRFPVDSSFFVYLLDRPKPTQSSPYPSDTLGILFSPTGAVDRVIFNGTDVPSTSRLVLMLGRIENAGIEVDPDSSDVPWVIDSSDLGGGQGDSALKSALEEKREQINWLNSDTRLLSIVTNNGRVVVSEPAFVPNALINSSDPDYPSNLTNKQIASAQIEAARAFAESMSTVGGN